MWCSRKNLDGSDEADDESLSWRNRGTPCLSLSESDFMELHLCFKQRNQPHFVLRSRFMIHEDQKPKVALHPQRQLYARTCSNGDRTAVLLLLTHCSLMFCSSQTRFNFVWEVLWFRSTSVSQRENPPSKEFMLTGW